MPDAGQEIMRIINTIAKVWWVYASFLLFVIVEVCAIYGLYRWMGLIR